jgi:hypothetical protein
MNDPVFASAAAELAALGFRISDRPHAGALPYAVVGARSNHRWWLIPLTNARVAVAGLALFQPVLASARFLKGAAATASALGLSALWARRRLYVSGVSCLSDVFRERDLHYAFFTGTESPHRKAAVQVMDGAGNLRGFAKIGRSAAVKALLLHEARTLGRVRELQLQTARVPTVLHRTEVEGAALLVTDTRKTRAARTVVGLERAHVAFVRELGEKALARDVRTGATRGVRQAYEELAARLPTAWRSRLGAAIARLVDAERALPPRTLSHGDFTPWNTFLVDGSLYVFDWEYAEDEVPVGSDLVHFCFSSPAVGRRSAHDGLASVRAQLRDVAPETAEGPGATDLLVLDYLCRLTLRYAAREAVVDGPVATWTGEREAAARLDALLERPR